MSLLGECDLWFPFPWRVNALAAVGALMTLIIFTLSNARRFYSSMGNPLAVKGLIYSLPVLARLLFSFLSKPFMPLNITQRLKTNF